MILQLMLSTLTHTLITPLALKLGSSRIILMGKDKKFIFDEPAVVARSTVTGTIIAFGKEAKELANLGTSEIEILTFFSKGILIDDGLFREFLLWMRTKIEENIRSAFLPIPVIVSHSVGLPDPYRELVKQALWSASFIPCGLYPAIVADMAFFVGQEEEHTPRMVIHLGATHVQIGLVRGTEVLSAAIVRRGGDDIDRSLMYAIRVQEGVSVPLSFIQPLKEQYTKALSAQTPFSAVVRGRAVQTGMVQSVQVRADLIAPVIDDFFSALTQDIVWEMHTSLGWDVATHTETEYLLTGAVSVFPQVQTLLTSAVGEKLKPLGRVALTSVLGLPLVWQK